MKYQIWIELKIAFSGFKLWPSSFILIYVRAHTLNIASTNHNILVTLNGNIDLAIYTDLITSIQSLTPTLVQILFAILFAGLHSWIWLPDSESHNYTFHDLHSVKFVCKYVWRPVLFVKLSSENLSKLGKIYHQRGTTGVWLHSSCEECWV